MAWTNTLRQLNVTVNKSTNKKLVLNMAKSGDFCRSFEVLDSIVLILGLSS